jgi:hypothetical protein
MTFYQWLHEYTIATGVVSVWQTSAEDLLSDRIMLVVIDGEKNIKSKKKMTIPSTMSDEMAMQAVRVIIDNMIKENNERC